MNPGQQEYKDARELEIRRCARFIVQQMSHGYSLEEIHYQAAAHYGYQRYMASVQSIKDKLIDIKAFYEYLD